MKTIPLLTVLASILYFGCSKPAHRATTTSHFFNASTSSGSLINMNDSDSNLSSDSMHFRFQGQCWNGGATMEFYHYAHTLGTFPIDNSNQNIVCDFNDFHGNSTVAHGIITVTTIAPDFIGTFAYTSVDSTIITGSFNLNRL